MGWKIILFSISGWPFWESSIQTNIWWVRWTGLFLAHFLVGISSCFVTSPWGIWFPKRRFWNQILKQIFAKGGQHFYFSPLSFREVSLRSPNSLSSIWFPQRFCLSSASFPEEGTAPEHPPRTVLKLAWNRSERFSGHNLRLYAVKHFYFFPERLSSAGFFQ